MNQIEIPTLAKQDDDKERRRGAVPLVLARGGRPSGFNSLLWGVNGRGGLLAMLGARLTRHFAPLELAILGLGLAGGAALGLMALGGLGAGEDEERLAVVWPAAGAGDPGAYRRSSGALEDARPSPSDLLAGELASGGPEPAPADVPAAVEEPAAPGAGSEPAQAAEARGAVEEALGAASKPSLSGTLGFGRGARAGGELRDGLNSFSGLKTVSGTPFRPLEARPAASSAFSRPAGRPAARSVGLGRARSSRALGQLRAARRDSALGRGAAAGEQARTFSADAFEQGRTTGGEAIGGAGLRGTEVAAPLGVGASDVTEPPAVGPGENKTPYQDKADEAKKGIDMGKALVLMGLALLAGGAMLMSYAKSLLSNPLTMAQGKSLMMVGKAMLAAGAAALLMGLMTAKDAKKKGREIGSRSGQREQGAIVEDCADASARGQDCRPRPFQMPASAVEQNGGPI